MEKSVIRLSDLPQLKAVCRRGAILGNVALIVEHNLVFASWS